MQRMPSQASVTPVEHVWYFAKAIPDAMRNEPRNMGLVLRNARDVFLYRLRSDRPTWMPEELYAPWLGWSKGWTEQFEKYGIKTTRWMLSRKNPSFFWEFGGSRIVPEVAFDAMYEELVL